MVHEEFADEALKRMGDEQGQTLWIEPIWKMLWSNKGILPVLWRLFPDHPNLLPAFFEGEEHNLDELRPQAAARARGRELADRDRRRGGRPRPGPGLRRRGLRRAAVHRPRHYDGNHPVLGVWTVDMEPAGLGIRESTGLVTNNLSRFVPHIIAD